MSTDNSQTERDINVSPEIGLSGIGFGANARDTTNIEFANGTEMNTSLSGSAGIRVGPQTEAYIAGSANLGYETEDGHSQTYSTGVIVSSADGIEAGVQAQRAYNNPDPEIGSVNTWDVTAYSNLDNEGVIAAIRGGVEYGIHESSGGNLTSIYTEAATGCNTRARECGVSIEAGVSRDVSLRGMGANIRAGVGFNSSSEDYTNNDFTDRGNLEFNSNDGQGVNVGVELSIPFGR